MSGWRRVQADGSQLVAGAPVDYYPEELAVGFQTAAPFNVTGTEAAPTTIITLPTVTLDGTTEVIAEFSFETQISNQATWQTCGINLWSSYNGGAAADISRFLYSMVENSQYRQGGTFRARWTPPAGTHQWSARGWITGGATWYIYGGPGPSGPAANTAAVLRAIRATPYTAVPMDATALRAVYCRLVRTAATGSLTANTWNAIPWQVAEADTDGMWSAANPTRVTCKRAGKHVLTCGAQVTPGDQATERHLALRKNGATYVRRVRFVMPSTAIYPEMEVASTLDLAVGDYIEAMVWPGPATTATIGFEFNQFPTFEAVRVGP